MVIDFHTHVFPDHLAHSTIQALSREAHAKAFSDGTVAGLKASMARAGVDHAIVLPVVTNPVKTAKINDLSAQMNQSQSELIYFGGIHPDTPDCKQELTRMARMGLKGFKIHPVYQGADLDDPRYVRIFQWAGELGLIVVAHMGIDIGYPTEEKCTPQRLCRVLQQVGPVTVVAAHMGGWRFWKQAKEVLASTSVYIDTSFSTGEVAILDDGHYQPGELTMLSPQEFMDMKEAFGADRILYATDSPWTDHQESLDWLKALPLTQEEQDKIFGGNARKLLHI